MVDSFVVPSFDPFELLFSSSQLVRNSALQLSTASLAVIDNWSSAYMVYKLSSAVLVKIWSSDFVHQWVTFVICMESFFILSSYAFALDKISSIEHFWWTMLSWNSVGSGHWFAILWIWHCRPLRFPVAALCALGLAVCYWTFRYDWHFFLFVSVDDLPSFYLLMLASQGGPVPLQLLVVPGGKSLLMPSSVMKHLYGCSRMRTCCVGLTDVNIPPINRPFNTHSS